MRKSVFLKRLFYILISVCVSASCRQAGERHSTSEEHITLSPDYYLFASEGHDSLIVDIVSTSDWSVSTDADWIEIRRLSSSRAMVVSGGAPSQSSRFGIVVFTSGNCSDTLIVERFSNSFSGGDMNYSDHPHFLLSSPIL